MVNGSEDMADHDTATKQPEAPTQPTAKGPVSIEEQVHLTVHKWLHECIHNGPVAAVTNAYNALVKDIEELKARLIKDLKGKE